MHLLLLCKCEEVRWTHQPFKPMSQQWELIEANFWFYEFHRCLRFNLNFLTFEWIYVCLHQIKFYSGIINDKPSTHMFLMLLKPENCATCANVLMNWPIFFSILHCWIIIQCHKAIKLQLSLLVHTNACEYYEENPLDFYGSNIAKF